MSLTKCARFGEGYDLLGKSVQFNYKRGPRYGTALGGYCSLAARLFIWFLAAVEIYSCFSSPLYIESTKNDQLVSPNNDTFYEISLDQGFPAFYTYYDEEDES